MITPSEHGGQVRKVPERNLYTLTDLGYRVALYWTKLHHRLLSPSWIVSSPPGRPAVATSAHPLDRALTQLNACFDHLAAVSAA